MGEVHSVIVSQNMLKNFARIPHGHVERVKKKTV